MDKLARWGLIGAVLLAASACSSNPPSVSTVPLPQTLPGVSAQDQAFVNLAASSDLFEIQSSHLALQRSRNPATRRFAQRMIDDHTKSSQSLAALAPAKGLILPTGLDPEGQRRLAAIDNTRRIFDQEYFRQQGEAHQAAVQAFETEISSGYDADLRGFAQQTLPIIQDHLRMAESFRGQDMTRTPARP
jgi:putative membrane protein